MATATCKFKPTSRTYDFHYDREEMSLEEGDLVIVESDYAPYGFTIVRVEEVDERDRDWAKKSVLQKLHLEDLQS